MAKQADLSCLVAEPKGRFSWTEDRSYPFTALQKKNCEIDVKSIFHSKTVSICETVSGYVKSSAEKH